MFWVSNVRITSIEYRWVAGSEPEKMGGPQWSILNATIRNMCILGFLVRCSIWPHGMPVGCLGHASQVAIVGVSLVQVKTKVQTDT